MARYTGAVCRLCRREGKKLFLKLTNANYVYTYHIITVFGSWRDATVKV